MDVKDNKTLSSVVSKLKYKYLDDILKSYGTIEDFTPITIEEDGSQYSVMARYSKQTNNVILVCCIIDVLRDDNNRYECVCNYNVSLSPKFVL